MKILDSQLNDFLATCREAKTIEALIKSGSASFQDIGFSGLIFHYMPHLGSHDYNLKKITHVPKAHKRWLIETFPEHISNSSRDPFEKHVFKTGQAIWTDELKTLEAFQSSDQQEFLELMTNRFGSSLIVPVFGPRRSRGCFFLPGKTTEKIPDTKDTVYIEHMCSFFHLCYTKLRTMKPKSFSLTPREHEVLQLIPLGLTNKEIAEKLEISPHTVNGYIKQLFEKFEATDRVLVAQRAFALDLIE